MRRRLSRLLGCSVLTVGSAAFATQPVVVRTSSSALEPIAGRLCAELASAGYAVTFELSEVPPSCEQARDGSDQVSWIGLHQEPNDRERLLASVCFDGALVVVDGSRSEAVRFVVSTAEALNGLEATGPTARSARPAPKPVPAQARRSLPPPVRLGNSLSLGQMLLLDPNGFPPLWGSALELELALGPHVGITIGAFMPLSRAELAGAHAVLKAALAFVRVGAALRYSLDEVAFSGWLGAGPALTWVTAEAASPYVGGSDFALGALGAAGGSVQYPGRGPVFAVAGARASLLLPVPRFVLPQEEHRDLGPLLFEACFGLGWRF